MTESAGPASASKSSHPPLPDPRPVVFRAIKKPLRPANLVSGGPNPKTRFEPT